MEISNKALVMFIVVSIVVSVGGTIVSLNKLNKLSYMGPAGTTGQVASNTTGTATITVASLTTLIFSSSSVAWGSGQLNTANGNQRCNLSTISGGNYDGAYCLGFTNSSNNLTLENAGTTVLNVSINMSQTADAMFGGSAPYFYITALNASTRPGCDTTLNQTTQNATTTMRNICERMDYSDSGDRIDLVVNVSFAYDAVEGSKTMTVTASGEATA